MSLGDRIKAYITDRGIKQSFLAENAGVSDSVMSKMLNNQLNIDAVQYHRICKALRVDLNYFFEDEE